MERTQVLDLMGTLKLYGMRSAYDEIMTTAIKRQHEPPRVVGDLLSAEIAEKQARSIKYQLTVAKLPLAKDIDDFDFAGTPVNETLVRDLATGAFVADQRNAVLIGGTGTGKSHLAIAIARALIRNGTRGRFFNVVDLVNRLETEHRSGKQGRISGKSKLAEAIRYALARRVALERFLADGRIEIDSNIVERAIRPQTITRKNSLFAGSDGGGRAWATIATMLQTAKMNRVDPYAWLKETLERLAQGWPINKIDGLMPWNFKA